MTLIDGDRIVTAQLYDDEHEEFTEEKMSIIDYVNLYTTEGVTTADDMLDKIRAEINRQYKWLINTRYTIRDVDIAFGSIFRIIDKYKTESEDKE